MDDFDLGNAASRSPPTPTSSPTHLLDQTRRRSHSRFLGRQRRCLLKLKRLQCRQLTHRDRAIALAFSRQASHLFMHNYLFWQKKPKAIVDLRRFSLQIVSQMSREDIYNSDPCWPSTVQNASKPAHSLKCFNQSEGRSGVLNQLHFKLVKGWGQTVLLG